MKFTQTRRHLEYIPELLFNTVDKGSFSHTQRDQAFSILASDILFSKQPKDASGFVYIPKSYFLKKYGSGYHKVIKHLVNLAVIDRVESYSTVHHICKQYRINPELLKGRITPVSFKKKYRQAQFSNVENDTYNLLSNVSLDLPKAIRRLKTYIKEKEYLKKVKIQNAVTDTSFKVSMRFRDGRVRNFYTSRTRALEISGNTGMTLIKDRNRFLLMDFDLFIEDKERDIYLNHIRSLKKLDAGVYYAKRNECNFRLDSPLTNLSSIYFPFLKISSKANVNIDIVNSQMSLLLACIKGIKFKEDQATEDKLGKMSLHNVHKMKRSTLEDSDILFQNLVVKGGLYSFIQEKLKLGTRLEAKLLCFKTLFSHHRYRGPDVLAFEQLFPAIYKSITEFKKEFGSNQLAITLQKLESLVIVDTVLPILRKKGIIAFTKHDSIICTEDDMIEVKTVMESCLRDFNVECQIAIEK